MRKTQHRNFHRQYYRYPHIELRVLRLVMEHPHSDHSPDSSSENRQEKQRALRNTPLSPDGFSLVYPEKKKCRNVNGYEVDNETGPDVSF